MSVDDYMSIAESPSRRTLFSWIAQRKRPPTAALTPKKRGRPSALSRAEELVMGGWVLHRCQMHRPTTGNHIIVWVKKHFGVAVSKTWVTRTARSLKLSSHRVRARQMKYQNPQLVRELRPFILNAYDLIKEINDPSRVVAVDTVRWTTPPYQIRSYGPAGGRVSIQFSCFLNFTHSFNLFLFSSITCN